MYIHKSTYFLKKFVKSLHLIQFVICRHNYYAIDLDYMLSECINNEKLSLKNVKKNVKIFRIKINFPGEIIPNPIQMIYRRSARCQIPPPKKEILRKKVLFENFREIVWFKKFGLKKLRKIIKKCLLFNITRWWQKCHRLNDYIWQRNRKTLVRFTTSISIRQENISIISMTFSLFTRKPSRFSIPIQYIYLPTLHCWTHENYLIE